MTATSALPRGAGAVMASRREPPDSLEFFPTPPWATRALFEHVLPYLGARTFGVVVQDPACGEGHMAEAISDYTAEMPVIATDIFDYGYGKAPVDFLSPERPYVANPDLIVCNPPFSTSVEFTLRAQALARQGVAMLCRSQWIEGSGRYKGLFRDNPPALVAPFVERVPMVKGRWDPDASTATSYTWFVWSGAAERTSRVFWIPPGCRTDLTRLRDREDFAPWTLHRPTDAELCEIPTGLCLADGQDPEQPVRVPSRDTLTYYERRAAKPGQLDAIVQVPQWRARRREADDLHARALTREAIRARQQRRAA